MARGSDHPRGGARGPPADPGISGESRREVDPEHFGLSIPYARTEPDSVLLRGLQARRPDIDPLVLLPVGPQALRELILRHIDAGLSKFVVRPAAVTASWPDEIDWLASTILDLQT
jgi:hypothetical protein